MDLARSRFLREASHQLFQADSSTSAHLSAEQLGLQSGIKGIKAEKDLRCCKACGTIWISGLSMDLKMATLRRKGKQPKVPAQQICAPATTISAVCLACGKSTRQVSQGKLRSSTSKKARSTASGRTMPLSNPAVHKEPPAGAAAVQPSQATSQPEPKLSSKQRAKARKDRDGLQALLNRSRPDQPSTKLSLKDFMKR